MWKDLRGTLPPPPQPDGPDIRRVTSREHLADYATLLAANWDPADVRAASSTPRRRTRS